MIRVIIERYIKDGSFHDYLDLIRRARKQASSNEGFIAGELLQEKSNPNHAVIISSWEDFKSWDEWQASSNRQSVLQQMRPLLERDEKVTVLEGSHSWKILMFRNFILIKFYHINGGLQNIFPIMFFLSVLIKVYY